MKILILCLAAFMMLASQPYQVNLARGVVLHRYSKANSETFIARAVQQARYGIALATLAKERSDNPAVRELASTVQYDCREMMATLAAVVKYRGTPILTTLTTGQKLRLQKLETLAASQFDNGFINSLHAEEANNLAFYTKHRHLKSEVVRNFIRESTPVFQSHLNAATVIQKDVAAF